MSLATLLETQRDGLQRLTALLEQECEALAAGQIDGELLQRLAADKQALLAQLEHSEQQRRAFQTAGGYPEGDAGARQAARDAGCLDAWQAVRAASEHAARRNELAGSMLWMRLKQNQRMLDLIHAVSEKTLYDPQGRTGPRSARLKVSA
ncbi:MAG: flagella synthesis protein FlgN [Halochromatium sp.]|uniref:flagella synthesis protein FlgN n=1 Tax=Halochromatium sp. TaxID=2049430 RepID=UPI00397A1E9F